MQEQSSLKCKKCGERVSARLSDANTLKGIELGKECGCADKYIFKFEQHDKSVANESTR